MNRLDAARDAARERRLDRLLLEAGPAGLASAADHAHQPRLVAAFDGSTP